MSAREFQDWLDSRFEPDAPAQPAEAPAAHARRSDPWTSWAAARGVQDVTGRQAAVYYVFWLHSTPFSHDELIDEYGRVDQDPSMPHLPSQTPQSIRSRCSELVAAGVLEPSGSTKIMPSGRHSIRWRIAHPANQPQLF